MIVEQSLSIKIALEYIADESLSVMPSTVISKFFYNTDSCILKIVFVSGLVYEYKNVPENIYEAMKASGSKGIYFNQHIKGKFEFKKAE